MSIQLNAVHRQVKASEIPLEKLAANPQCSQSEKVSEASRQFEAVLLRQIFSEAQKTVFQSKYADSSTAGDIYRDMVSTQLADQVSRSGALGLGQALEGQLKKQLRVGEEPKAEQAPGAPAEPTHKPMTPTRYD